MNAILTVVSEEYRRTLANKTWPNKLEYCERHGWEALMYADKENEQIGWTKLFRIVDLMIHRKDIEWVWALDCDSLITNMNINPIDLADEKTFFLTASDRNAHNAGSFLVRLRGEGCEIVNYIAERYPHHTAEQWAIEEFIKNHRDSPMIKIVPQRLLNSYDYTLYGPGSNQDLYGNVGQWEKGDLVIHWPGTFLETRMAQADKYIGEVVR